MFHLGSVTGFTVFSGSFVVKYAIGHIVPVHLAVPAIAFAGLRHRRAGRTHPSAGAVRLVPCLARGYRVEQIPLYHCHGALALQPSQWKDFPPSAISVTNQPLLVSRI